MGMPEFIVDYFWLQQSALNSKWDVFGLVKARLIIKTGFYLLLLHNF